MSTGPHEWTQPLGAEDRSRTPNVSWSRGRAATRSGQCSWANKNLESVGLRPGSQPPYRMTSNRFRLTIVRRNVTRVLKQDFQREWNDLASSIVSSQQGLQNPGRRKRYNTTTLWWVFCPNKNRAQIFVETHATRTELLGLCQKAVINSDVHFSASTVEWDRNVNGLWRITAGAQDIV